MCCAKPANDHLSNSEAPTENYHVIARPQAVAISWYCVRFRTLYQEIATSLRSSQ